MDGTEFPPGYGTAFDREGNLLYTGMWKDGKRCGSGTEFDENGEIVFSGEWKDGKYHNGILYKKLTKDELSEASDRRQASPDQPGLLRRAFYAVD